MGWWDKLSSAAPTAASMPRNYPAAGTYIPPPAYQPPEPVYQGDMGINVAVAAGNQYRPKAGKVESARDSARCPECGGSNFFSRMGHGQGGVVSASGAIVPPAPHCAECGYNGKFRHTGSDLNSIHGANTGVPVKVARQDSMSKNGGLDYTHPIKVG